MLKSAAPQLPERLDVERSESDIQLESPGGCASLTFSDFPSQDSGMNEERRGSLSLSVVLLAVALGLVAIAGGGFIAFRYWRQQPAMNADFNVRQE